MYCSLVSLSERGRETAGRAESRGRLSPAMRPIQKGCIKGHFHSHLYACASKLDPLAEDLMVGWIKYLGSLETEPI